MHLLLLSNEYPPAPHGGIGSYVQTLGQAYAQKGVDVTVFGLYDPQFAGTSEDEGVRVVRLGRKGPPGLRVLANHYRLLVGLRRIHAETPIDLIEGDEDTCTILGMHPRVPTVLRMHGGHAFFEHAAGRQPRAWQMRLERSGFRNADHLVAVSNYVGQQTRALLGLGTRTITVIPNCVNLNLFRPRPNITPQDGLIVFTGTLIEKKWIGQLLQALPLVAATYPAVRLEVYGGDTTDPNTGKSYQQTLEAEIPESLRSHVAFLGRVQRGRLPEILARASICCYPSHMEAMPIAWIEGMAMGKAVLASELGPGPEVVNHGVDGLLVDPRHPARIAEALTGLLKDPALRQRLGDAARRRAESNYSLPHLVDRNLAYYDSLLGGKP